MFSKTIFNLFILYLFTFSAKAQYYDNDSTKSKYFIGSTFFMIGNLAPTNKPDFVQLNLGYRLSAKDVVSIELKTWKYAWPLGIPYGKFFEAPGENFPGFIRERGLAVAYQRFWYKGLYTGIHVMNAFQTFSNENGEKFDKGFQIFNTYRLGYHVKLFNKRAFIEPSIAITHRPYQTNMPEQFEVVNNKWPKYFIGEPGLHFGINF
ncbi:MAG: hypothetical protein ACPGLV_14050 [Bacteroidia bacterium]